jgi:hypothetical protein
MGRKAKFDKKINKKALNQKEKKQKLGFPDGLIGIYTYYEKKN